MLTNFGKLKTLVDKLDYMERLHEWVIYNINNLHMLVGPYEASCALITFRIYFWFLVFFFTQQLVIEMFVALNFVIPYILLEFC